MSPKLCVVALVAACGSSSPPPPSNARAPELASRSHAVAAMEVWPERWPRVQAALAMLRPMLGKDVELAGPTLWATLRPLADRAGLAKLALPPPGLDQTAPISLEVFAPTQSFEITAAALARAFASHQPLPSLPSPRVRVTLPATDAKALADALRAAAASEKPRVRIVAGARAVAVDFAYGGPLTGDPEPPAVPTLFDPGGDSAARAILRVDGLGDVGASVGMVRTALALGDVDDKRRSELLRYGTAELITIYALIDPSNSVASEALVDVPDRDEPPRVAFVLSDAGVKTLTAAGLARGKTLPVAHLEWRASIDVAPHSPLVAAAIEGSGGKSGKKLQSEIVTLFVECGPFCFLYVALGNGFQFALATDATAFTDSFASALGTAEATWTEDNLVFVHPANKVPRGTWKRAPAAAPSPANACYRKALVAVRAELRAGVAGAKSALDAAAPCMQSDPAIAARGKAIGEFVGGVSP